MSLTDADGCRRCEKPFYRIRAAIAAGLIMWQMLQEAKTLPVAEP